MIVIVLYVSWVQLRKFVKKQFIQKGPHDRKEGNIQLILNAMKYIMALFAALAILQINGVDISSISTGLGIAGIVVGFALQDALQDWIMGISILWERYFSVGDLVKYGDYEGYVTKVTFKTTKIKDINTGSLIVISNRNISEVELTSDWFELNIPAPYEIPATQMREVCNEIVERTKQKEIIRDCSLLGTDSFADYCVFYRFYIKSKEDNKGDAQYVFNGIVQDVYAEKGISFPCRQMDIRLKQ